MHPRFCVFFVCFILIFPCVFYFLVKILALPIFCVQFALRAEGFTPKIQEILENL